MIAREGLLFIVIGIALSGLVIIAAARWDNRWLFSISLVLVILTFFTTFFFRDPPRSCSDEPNLLVSPADGKIIGIDTVTNHDFIGGAAIKVSIFLSVFDVHVNRIPTSGEIDFVRYNPGEFFPAFEDKASDKNEQTEIGMTTTSGARIVFKQIAGLIARRIVCHVNEGDRVLTGARFGIIRFGSRTELFIPVDCKLSVRMGQHVKGAETIIGYLPGGSKEN